MIKVTIDHDAKTDRDISSSWITDRVNRMRSSIGYAAASVQIDQAHIHLTFATPGAGDVPPSVRPLTTQERQLMNTWARLHLDTNNFAASELAAFVRPFIH